KSAPARRVPRTNRVERTGRAAGETVRGPELDLPPLILPEGFVREDIGEARLRIDLESEVLSERAVPVDAQAQREEIAVPDVEEALSEGPAGDDADPVLERASLRSAAERDEARAGELLAPTGDRVLLAAHPLHAGGPAGAKVGQQVHDVRAGVVEREGRARELTKRHEALWPE